MIKLGGLVELKALREAEEDKYTHIGYGKYKEKGKEDDKDSPTFKKDGEKFVPTKGDKAVKGGDSSAGEEKPKVNIFNKPKADSKSDGMETVKSIAAKTGLRAQALAGWADENGVNLSKVSNDIDSKKLKPMDLMAAIAGNPNNKYSKDIIAKYSQDGDSKEPSKEEPKSEPSQPKRQGNPQVNKATLAKAKKLGITPEKLGKEEYQKKMAQAAIEALTDSNFHSEARELVAKLEGKPELAEKPDYPDVRDPKFNEKMSVIKAKYASKYTDDVDGDARKLGIGASQEAGWSGDDAVDSIAFSLRKNGFNDLADKIQSVIKENKSTRLKDL